MSDKVSIEAIAKQLIEDTAISVAKEDTTWTALRSNLVMMGEHEPSPAMMVNEAQPTPRVLMNAVRAVQEAAVGIQKMNAALMPVVESGTVYALIDACESAVGGKPNLSVVAAHLQKVAET